ncbi:hypothetical protein COU57_00920 [Candidatus Pacearchaeota archaeon CG10_big_fil_rev_8_21_14_0_10_32_14]|nr:MAG: hypothetical protein COU57_00920 [Candidatus Pacearchaeota archaeon CG10_big_fil_rev_8_21_14_0_10_32_14]
MAIKTFEEYLKIGIIKKQSPNKFRSLSLIKESDEKKEFLQTSLKLIPKNKMNYNFIVDSSYDIIMELIRAKMFTDGYNAGNSHEAEVSYLSKLNFSQMDIVFMDELRYFRNGTKYYGKILDEDYAKKVLGFMVSIVPKLKKLIQN